MIAVPDAISERDLDICFMKQTRRQIQRLNRKSFVPLEQVKILHDWLEGKRQVTKATVAEIRDRTFRLWHLRR